jgi:tellurite resistance protein TerB
MVLGFLKKVGGAAAKEVKAEYGENKDFLEAVCAASALVAAADGDIEESEKRKVLSIISNHAQLGKLYQQNVIEATADTMFKRAKDSSGRQQLARELDDIKSRPQGAQMAEDVYLIAVDIALADGEIEPQEKDVLAKIANRLGVDPSKFEF